MPFTTKHISKSCRTICQYKS